MQYTLGQAKEHFATTASGQFGVDVTRAINNAIRSLSDMSGWECLRKVLRFVSAGPCFTLPQGCAGLVRVCVNGHPSTVRGQDFRFLHSGPGDLRNPPRGFIPVPTTNVIDLGFSPVMYEPQGEFTLVAYADVPPNGKSADGQTTYDTDPPNTYKNPVVTFEVRGISPVGKDVTAMVKAYPQPVYNPVTGGIDCGIALGDLQPTEEVFAKITSVVLPEKAPSYITLYAVHLWDRTLRCPVAVYHPDVRVPEFRKYEICGPIPRGALNILAEVRIDPLPLIRDSDVLPFGTLDPIGWMIRADWETRSGELDRAEKLRDQAGQWLKAKEIANDTIQTQIVINSLMHGSPGEISMEAENI